MSFDIKCSLSNALIFFLSCIFLCSVYSLSCTSILWLFVFFWWLITGWNVQWANSSCSFKYCDVSRIFLFVFVDTFWTELFLYITLFLWFWYDDDILLWFLCVANPFFLNDWFRLIFFELFIYMELIVELHILRYRKNAFSIFPFSYIDTSEDNLLSSFICLLSLNFENMLTARSFTLSLVREVIYSVRQFVILSLK